VTRIDFAKAARNEPGLDIPERGRKLVTRIDFAKAGHLAVANECRYGRCTEIPGYRISSVGDWFPKYSGGYVREDIGFQRAFETMVFAVAPGDALCECGCGMAHDSRVNYSELLCIGAQNSDEADENHAATVKLYQSMEPPSL
jgi:hypothetical protein